MEEPAVDACPSTPHAQPRGEVDSSIAKALRLLDSFSETQPVLGLSQLAERAHLPRSTTHRVLALLVEQGYVSRIADRYALANHVFELGNHTPSCRPHGLRDTAMPHLSELFAETRQTVHLAVLDGTEILYIAKVHGPASAQCNSAVGQRRPAHATALGKMLLAHAPLPVVERVLNGPLERFTPYTAVTRGALTQQFEKARREGIAVDCEESTRGLACIAAPIKSPSSPFASAAISITTRASSESLVKYRPKLEATARVISAELRPWMDNA